MGEEICFINKGKFRLLNTRKASGLLEGNASIFTPLMFRLSNGTIKVYIDSIVEYTLETGYEFVG